ncbi:hypothetical protein PSACC_02523 [Paramicrosporidium saccamoebae]|uniref:TTI1 C-terminal TPR domain-containing protein n=1 Tax=Paramicrosporidium saccamoebae TaxID=1246581 RepID=A0A2H9TIT3_9FUNG|nr:hypothetical protein PSACC_02523 [Paramicrosporidium saccamoebae]
MLSAGRILSLLAASLDDKLPEPVSMNIKTARLKELQMLIENMPLELLGNVDMYQPLGYVLNVLLKTIDGSFALEYRKIAAASVRSLLGRHPNDEFPEFVMPGTCTALLKFLCSWEKEPIEVVKMAVDCMSSMLRRAHRRAERDGKLSILLTRLAGLCYSIRSTPLAVKYTEMLIEMLLLAEHLKDETVLLPVIRGLALMGQPKMVAKSWKPKTLPLAVTVLDTTMEFVAEANPKVITVRHLEEIHGLCEFVPPHLWPTATVATCKPVIMHLAQQAKLPTYLNSLDQWGWESDIDRTSMKLVELFRDVNMINFEFEGRPEAHELLVFGKANKESIDAVDKLIGWFDEYSDREVADTNADNVLKEENLWHLAWCSAANCILWGDKSCESLIRPLLRLKTALNVPVQEAANVTGTKLAVLFGFDSFHELLQDRGEVLLNNISADLRYPTLFPHTPLVLAELIRSVDYSLHATVLLDIVRELEDRAWQYQRYSGYSLSLLSALKTTLSVFRNSETPVPKDPKIEEEEPLNLPMTIEEELTDAALKVAIHFVTSDEERIRLEALEVLHGACRVFTKERSSVFLPVVHSTWRPLVARLTDPSLIVARYALQIIGSQAAIAGSFMADRVQKELLPNIGAVFSRESATTGRVSSVFVVVDLLRSLGRISPLTIREAANMLLAPGSGINPTDVVRMIKCLAEIDADQIWYVLHVQHGTMSTLIHPSNLFPAIILPKRQTVGDPLLVSKCVIACSY